MDMLKIPQWIKTARKEDDGHNIDREWSEKWGRADDSPMMPPPIATLPEFTTHDEDLSLMQRAAVLHAQLRRKIETANVELAEAVLGRQGDQQKVAFLEKENAELRLDIAQLQNTIATLQADILDKDKFMSLVRQVLDRYAIKAPPKKERKPKVPKFPKQEAAMTNTEIP